MTPVDSRISLKFGIILFINDKFSKTNNILEKEIKKQNAIKMITWFAYENMGVQATVLLLKK